MNRNRLRHALYRASYWCFRRTAYAALAFVVAFVLIGNYWPHSTRDSVLNAWAGLFAAAMLLLFLFTCWYSLTFRTIAWLAARLGAPLRRWLASAWLGVVLLLLSVTILWWLRSWLIAQALPATARHAMPWQMLLSATSLWKILALTALILLVLEMYRARQRLVVMSFSNFAGEAYAAEVSGMAAGMLTGLRRLYGLFRTFDEAAPIPRKRGEVTDVAVDAGGAAEDLRTAISADSKIRLGPVELPIGAVFGVFSRVVQGPRLWGSLHKDGDRLVLTAQISGGSPAMTWRVIGPPPAQDSAAPGAVLGPLLNELVYRAFTDIAGSGSPSWRAMRCYCQGLREYRRTLRTMRQRTMRLRRAERFFIQALAEDAQFALCHYNLGIVYRDLKLSDSAVSAFRRALEADPKLAKAAEGLAVIALDKSEHGDALRYYNVSIAIDVTSARAWNGRGLALRRLHEKMIGRTLDHRDQRLWLEILETREIAAALAWRDLCAALFAGRDIQGVAPSVSAAIQNAAIAIHASGRESRGVWMLQQARGLAAASIHRELGRILLAAGRYTAAIGAFDAALRLGREPDCWAYIFECEARRFQSKGLPEYREAALRARQDAMRSPSDLSEGGFGSLAKGCAILNASDAALGTPRATPWLRLAPSLVQHWRIPRPSVRFWLDRAEQSQLAGRYTDAAQACREALRSGESPEAWAMLARAHAGQFAATGSSETRELALAAYRQAFFFVGPPFSPAVPDWLGTVDELLGVQAAQVQRTRPADQIDRIKRVLADVMPVTDEAVSVRTARLRLRWRMARYSSDAGWADGVLATAWAESRLRELDDGTEDGTTGALACDVAEVARCLTAAIEWFTPDHPDEIRDRDVYRLLASAQRAHSNFERALGLREAAQRSLEKALAAATSAVELNPQSATARVELGHAYVAQLDHDAAERHLEAARDLAAQDLYVLFNAANVQFRFGRDPRPVEARRAALERSVAIFKEFLEVEDNWDSRGALHFAIGQFQTELRNFGDSAYHLNVTLEMGYAPLTGRLWLCEGYYRCDAYAQLEGAVRELVREILRELFRVQEPPPETPVDLAQRLQRRAQVAGENISIVDFLAQSYLWLARATMERSDDRDRRAARYLRYARGWIERSSQQNQPLLRSSYHLELGWLYRKDGNAVQALRELDQAARLQPIRTNPDPEIYWRLARVYLDLATQRIGERAAWLQRAKQTCAEARLADPQGSLGDKLAELTYALARSV